MQYYNNYTNYSQIILYTSSYVINVWVAETPGKSKPTKLDSGKGARKRPTRTPPVGFRLSACP
jgi:hypothetical protein